MAEATEPQSGIGRRRKAALTDGNEGYKAKREKLISAAAEVFREKGYEAATLGDIAERVGTDRASLYYYVSGKEELFREAIAGVLDTNVREAERILKSEGDAPEKLRRLVKLVIVSYEQSYPYMYVYIQEDMRKVSDDRSKLARQMVRETRKFESMVVKLITQGMTEGTFRDDISPKLAANALFGMLNWTHRWFKPRSEGGATQVADAFSRLFLQGMQKTS